MLSMHRSSRTGLEPVANACDPRAAEAIVRSDGLIDPVDIFSAVPIARRAHRKRTHPCHALAGLLIRHRLLVLAFGLAVLGPTAARPDDKAPAVNVLRPTIQLRNGTHRGSGTVLVSVPGETLILTAAHVVRDASALQIELHRHNFGGSTTGLTEGGGWPRLVPARVVAADTAADVALVRITGMVALPYVARFDPDAKDPEARDVLTSVGIDRTLFLTRWRTTAQGTAMVDIGRGGGPRRFIVVTRYPEHGRSGGGLFRGDGTLVGVCVGQLTLRNGEPKVGIFASTESIHHLLRENGLDGTLRPTGPRTSESPKTRKAR